MENVMSKRSVSQVFRPILSCSVRSHVSSALCSLSSPHHVSSLFLASFRLSPLLTVVSWAEGEAREARTKREMTETRRRTRETTREASVRLGHKTLRTWMKNSSLW